jgi:hypothetical protein
MMAMSDYTGQISSAAQQAGIDPRLLASVIQTESSGDPSAYNASTGAAGLGQQIPSTAKALGVNPSDPSQSISGAAQLLAQNIKRYGNVDQAVAAYHGGTDPGNWGPKTQDYVQKVSQTFQGMPQPVAQASPQPTQASSDPLDQMLAAQASKGQAQQGAAPAPADPLDAMLADRAQGGSGVPRGTNPAANNLLTKYGGSLTASGAWIPPAADPEKVAESLMSPQERASAQQLTQDVQAPDASSLMNHGWLGRTVAGIGQGAFDTAQSLTKGLGLVGNELGLVPNSDLDTFMRGSQAEQQNYGQARQQNGASGVDWGRMGGQVAAAGGLSGTAEDIGQAGLQGLEKLGFQASQNVPTRLASMASTGVKNAVTGAGAAALASSQSSVPTGTQAAIGAGVGLLAPPLVSMAAGALARPLSGLVSKAMGTAPEAAVVAPDVAAQQASATMQQNAPSIMDAVSKDAQGGVSIDKSALPPQVQSLMTGNGPLANLTPAQQARVLNYEALGIKNYTVGDVTRNFSDTSAEQKLAANTVNPEMGAPLRAASQAKNDQLLQAANAAPRVMGAAPVNPDLLDSQLRAHLMDQRKILDTGITNEYTKADAAAGNAPQVAMSPVVQALQGNRSQFLASSDGKSLMNGIRARLQDFQGGPPTTASPPLIRDANGETLLAQADVPPATTFTDSERFRQYLNDVWSPENSSLINPIKKAVDQAQDAAGGGDIYTQARNLRQMRAAAFENQSGVSNLLATKPGGDPRMPVGQFMDKYVTNDSNPAQLKQVVNQLQQGHQQLLGMLDPSDPGNQQLIGRIQQSAQNGQKLLSQLRATTMQQAVDNSVGTTPGENGVGQFSGLGFSKQLGKIGSNMDTLFTPQQQNYLGALQRGAVDLTTVPKQVNLYNPSGTSGQFGLDVLSGDKPATLAGKAGKLAVDNLGGIGGAIGMAGGPKGAAAGYAAGKMASGQFKAAAERAAAKAQAAQGASAAAPLQSMAGINAAAQQAAQKARINQLIGQRLGSNPALLGGASQQANGQ